MCAYIVVGLLLESSAIAVISSAMIARAEDKRELASAKAAAEESRSQLSDPEAQAAGGGGNIAYLSTEEGGTWLRGDEVDPGQLEASPLAQDTAAALVTSLPDTVTEPAVSTAPQAGPADTTPPRTPESPTLPMDKTLAEQSAPSTPTAVPPLPISARGTEAPNASHPSPSTHPPLHREAGNAGVQQPTGQLDEEHDVSVTTGSPPVNQGGQNIRSSSIPSTERLPEQESALAASALGRGSNGTLPRAPGRKVLPPLRTPSQ